MREAGVKVPVNYTDFNALQLDVLREVGNIGTGNAVTSLSTMLDTTVDIQVPEICFLDYTTAAGRMGGPENTMVGILLSLDADVHGIMMFLLEPDFAQKMVDTLLGPGCSTVGVGMDEMASSVLCEVGNIMAASYVNALAQMTGLTIDISVPDVCIDMVGAIMSVPAIYSADISDQLMFIKTEFECDENKIRSNILLIPDCTSLTSILTKLGVEL